MPKLDESITLQPGVLRWARERAGLNREQLAANLKVQTQDIAEWERSGRLTFNEVDDLAKHTYTPVGYRRLFDQWPTNNHSPVSYRSSFPSGRRESLIGSERLWHPARH